MRCIRILPNPLGLWTSTAITTIDLCPAPRPRVPPWVFTANKGFIDFNISTQFISSRSHHGATHFMEPAPSCLVVFRTDRTDLGDREIWKTYIMFTRIERAFRSLKSLLGLRPNFHQIEHRADAHLFISVLAYHILHIIEHRLRQHGDHLSWRTCGMIGFQKLFPCL